MHTNAALIHGVAVLPGIMILNQWNCAACRYSEKVLNKNNLSLNYKSALNPKDSKTDYLIYCNGR